MERDNQTSARCPVCGNEYITGYNGRWCRCPSSIPKELIQTYFRLYYIIRDIEKASFSKIPSRYRKAIQKPFPDRRYKRLSTRIKKKNSHYARQAKLSTFYANSSQYATTNQYRYVKAVMNRYWDYGDKYGKAREGHIPQSWGYRILIFCLVWDHKVLTGKPQFRKIESVLEEFGLEDLRTAHDIKKIYSKISFNDVMTIIEEIVEHGLFKPDDNITPPPGSMISEIHDLINKPYRNSVTVNGRPYIK